MKIYWSDREGNSPPPHCKFSIRPFFSEKNRSDDFERVESLPKSATAKVIKKNLSPNREEWIRGVGKVLDAIKKKQLEKVVLARICTLEFDQAPDPFALAASLKQKGQGAFLFCLHSETSSFLGASPERLYMRKGRNIFSEAVAGTRPRGKSVEEDLTFQNDLLNSPKDLREIAPVQTYLQDSLAPLCTAPLKFSPLAIHQTQNVQHLYSQCSGMLKESITDFEILEHLHPTPALCGSPRESALNLIKELEPFERGLYGGAIGWSTEEESEWIVGIRSCLLMGNSAILYSGTGIVEGSDPEAEWEELNQKLKLYDSIFV